VLGDGGDEVWCTREPTVAFILLAPISRHREGRTSDCSKRIVSRKRRKADISAVLPSGFNDQVSMAHSVDHTCGARVFHRVQRTPYLCTKPSEEPPFRPESLFWLQVLLSDHSLLLSANDQSDPIDQIPHDILMRSTSHISGSHTQTTLRVSLSAIRDPLPVLKGIQRDLAFRDPHRGVCPKSSIAHLNDVQTLR